MPRPQPGRTRKPPYDAAQALAELSAADPKLARLIARAGPFTLRLPATQSPFEALARSIIYQQLHGKAAAAIHRKLLASFSDQPENALAPIALPNNAADTHTPALLLHPTPQQLLDAPNEQLRAAGLSHNKALALRDLAAKSLATVEQPGIVPTLAQMRRMSDADIIAHLSQVRGIGKWTVEMFLMFRLGRPNILPIDDYGVRKGFALTYLNLKPTQKVTPDLLATKEQITRRAKKWQPWSSVASWYMWRACDLAAGKLTQPE
jgi:DNA-3-methyladenine glycosylase II